MSSSSKFKCTSSKEEWAGLILSIIAINVTWWLLDIPLLWKHGFKRYIKSVMWQCFRLHMPGVAVLYSLRKATSPKQQAFIYYTGPVQTSNDPEDSTLSRLQCAKALLTDSITIVSTGITLSNAMHAPVGADISGFNSSQWAYPSLPVAVWGLWLLLCSRLQWQNWMTKWFGFLVIIIVGLALILPLALVSREYRSSGGWYPALIAYVVMGLPILAYFPQTTFIFNFIVVLARVGGIAGGALVPGAYFPFCQLKGKPFGITYLVVGCIGGFLATCGMFYFWGRALRERPAAQEAELPQIRGRRFVFQ